MTNFNTYADMTDAQARETAADIAAEQTDSLDTLVAPDDIQNGANTWDDIDSDTLEREAHESAMIMTSECQRPYDALVHDLAVVLFRNDTMRMPIRDLADHFGREGAVLEGYWPHDMNRTEVTDIIHNHHQDIHPDYWDEARQTVQGGIVEGLTDI
jgi:hypothetical protein